MTEQEFETCPKKRGPKNDAAFVAYIEKETQLPYEDGIKIMRFGGKWHTRTREEKLGVIYEAETRIDDRGEGYGMCVCGKKHLTKVFLWEANNKIHELGACCHEKIGKFIPDYDMNWYEAMKAWGEKATRNTLRNGPTAYSARAMHFILSKMKSLSEVGSGLSFSQKEYNWASRLAPLPPMHFDKHIAETPVYVVRAGNTIGQERARFPWTFQKRYIRAWPYHNKLEAKMLTENINKAIEEFEKAYPHFTVLLEMIQKPWFREEVKNNENEEDKTVRTQVQQKITDIDVPYFR